MGPLVVVVVVVVVGGGGGWGGGVPMSHTFGVDPSNRHGDTSLFFFFFSLYFHKNVHDGHDLPSRCYKYPNS